MNRLSLSQESVNFQSTIFFKELTLYFKELRELKAVDIPDSVEVTNLSKAIMDRTGLNVVFEIKEGGPAVQIPEVNKNNPLINQFYRAGASSADGVRMVNEAGGLVRGSASLVTGKVSGIFSEVKSTIYFPLTMITSSKFEPEENAAILLHEIGHLFTYYEFMARSVTTNQVLAGMSKALDQSGSIEERESILISVKKATGLSDLDAAELAKSTNSKATEIVVITNVAKQVTSELGSNIYDLSTWEYLADQYAARYGAGRYLATGLEKVYKGMWNISFRSLPTYLAFEALKLLILIGNPGLGFIILIIEGTGNHTYDKPGARVLRVRNQIVENLKDRKLSKEDISRLDADLVVIDELLSRVNDRRQFVEVVWNAFNSSSRNALNQKKLQQELEALAANDLFIKAAHLRQLSA